MIGAEPHRADAGHCGHHHRHGGACRHTDERDHQGCLPLMPQRRGHQAEGRQACTPAQGRPPDPRVGRGGSVLASPTPARCRCSATAPAPSTRRTHHEPSRGPGRPRGMRGGGHHAQQPREAGRGAGGGHPGGCPEPGQDPAQDQGLSQAQGCTFDHPASHEDRQLRAGRSRACPRSEHTGHDGTQRAHQPRRTAPTSATAPRIREAGRASCVAARVRCLT